MQSPVPRTGPHPSPWAAAIAQRYGLVLTAAWADWFDDFPAGAECGGEFGEPVSPALLLDAAPEVIWPGLMPPDLLPLVSNGLGDWLCARVSADSTIGEVVYWYHGGGDCLPYGKTMAEAIIYDAVSHRFPGRQIGLAIPATPREPLPVHRLLDSDAVRWACQHLPAAVSEVFRADFLPSETSAQLLQHGVAEVPIRCDLALAALDNEVRRRMTPQLAGRLNASWDQQVVRWMFDPGQMPAEHIQTLAQWWQLPPQQWHGQDWDVAAQQCRQIASIRQDLAWVHDILGWACQRRGDIDAAIAHYCRGATTSVFTDQAVRFRTHFDSDRACKFSIARLIELDAWETLDSDYVRRLVVDASPSDIDMTGWRDQTSQYWLDRAAEVAGTEATDAARRYDLIYRGGWDVGCDSITRYCHLLDALHDAAVEAGQTGRAILAKTHRDCFRSRYAIG